MDGNVIICSETYGSTGEQIVYVERSTGFQKLPRAQPDSRISLGALEDILKSVFLPQGYPDTVSKDYLQYQIWDSIQAFVSRLMGTLSTQAVLKGIGVGDEYATPLAATITWLLRDGTNNVARILFTWYQSTSLDYNSKQWRIYADVMNDAAFCFDLFAAHSGFLSTAVLCVAGICRATVEAAGGATRAAFIQHQARRDNLADVAAKDGSQETLVNLAGLLVSLVVMPLVGSNAIVTWLLFAFLVTMHLFANYKAIRAVSMETLNQLRLSILVKNFLENPQRMPSLEEVNRLEPIILGLKRSQIHLGCSFSKIDTSGLINVQQLQSLYSDCEYFLTFNTETHDIFIALRKNCSSVALLESSFQAQCLVYYLQQKDRIPIESFKKLDTKFTLDKSSMTDLAVLYWSREYTKENFPAFFNSLRTLGWETSHTLLGCDEWRTEWKSTKKDN